MRIRTDKIKKWIFVTGIIRSGTTFVGKVLSQPLEVDYIHEPFNKQCGIPALKKMPRYLSPDLRTEEAQRYFPEIARLFQYDFELRTYFSPKDPQWRKRVKRVIGSRGPFYLRLAKANPFHTTAVIKDPTGVLMAEYLYRNFGVRPVIMVKHPVSLIASLNRVDWWPTPEVMAMPSLIDDFFDDERDFMTRDWPSPELASAAYWRAVHKVLLKQSRRHDDWIIVTHEDLSAEPVHTFWKMYEALDLPWNDTIRRTIMGMTRSSGSPDAKEGKVQDFNRDSSSIFEKRRDSVPKPTRQAIFDLCQDVALQFYSRESFAID